MAINKKFFDFDAGGEVRLGDYVVGYRGATYERFDFPGLGVKDSNGNYMVQWGTSGSASVNYPVLTNSLTLNGVSISAGGADTNIDLFLTPKGAGLLNLDGMKWPTGPGTPGYVLTTDGVDTLSWASAGGSGSITWGIIAGTTQAALTDNGYIVGNAAQTTVTLPALAALGEVVAVEGLGAGGWILTANTGQTISIGTSTTSSAGTLTSAAASDNVYVRCIVANLTWRVTTTNSSGLTVA